MKRPQGLKLFLAHPSLHRLVTGALIGLAMGLLAAALSQTAYFQQVEKYTLDWRFKLRGRRTSRARVVVVAIDDVSSDLHSDVAMKDWGPYVARAIDALSRLHAAAIGIDMQLDVPSQGITEWSRAILQAQGRVVLPEYFYSDDEGHLHLVRGLDALNTAAEAAAPGEGVGVANSYADEDGILREFAPLQGDPGQPRPAFSLLLARRVRPQVPTHPFVINYLGYPDTVPHLSFRRIEALWQALQSGAQPGEATRRQLAAIRQQIAGAIVILGYTDRRFAKDFHQTPLGRMEGAEAQANIIATLLDGRPIQNLAADGRVAWGLLLLGTALGVLVTTAGPVRAALCGLLLLEAWLGGTWWAFLAHDRWIPVIQPTLTVPLAFGAALLWRQMVSEREMGPLRQYVGPIVLSEIRRNPRALEADGRSYDITVLFADIRAFTAWSQEKSPEEVVALLNRADNLLMEQVFRHGGTVDKFLGDGMMAFFGAPLEMADHAQRAVRCALEMQAAVSQDRELNAMFPGLQLGIGLHCGPAVVGFLQARQKPEYTAIGDTVNVAARLEDATKHFGAAIVMSAATFERMGAGTEFARLGAGFCVEGPCIYTPSNHDAILVYIVRRQNQKERETGR